MRKKTIGRFLCCFLMIALVFLSASCRRGTEDVTGSGGVGETTVSAPDAGTSSQSETETEDVTETAGSTSVPAGSETTTEPVAGMSAAEVVKIFNEQNETFFAEKDSAEVDAERMFGEMMPYLMGDGTFLDGGSYQITNFVTTGSDASVPTEVISRDGVTVYTGVDPVYGPYREIEVSHARGTVLISTYEGLTTVDSVELTSESEDTAGMTFQIPPMEESALSESGEVNVWNLSEPYAAALLVSLTGEADIVTSQFGNKVSGILDARALESEGKLLLSVTADGAQIDLTAELGFADIGQDAQHVELAVEMGVAASMQLAATVKGGEVTEMHMSTVSDGVETVVEQVVSDKHVDFTMSVGTQDVTALEVSMSMDMRDDNTCMGTLNMTLSANGEGIGADIMPLSTSAAGNGVSVTQGEFVVQLIDGEIGMMEMVTQTRLGTVTTQMTIMMSGANAVVGETVLYYATDVKDSTDPSADTRSETEIKLVSGNAENGTYTMGTSYTDATGTVLTTAEIAVPARLTPAYTEQEATFLSRAERLFSQADDYTQQAQEVVDWVAAGINNNRFMPLLETFYLKDTDGDGIVFLVDLVYENGYYIYTDILLDVENYTYFYSAYDEIYDLCTQAGIMADRDRLEDALSAHDDAVYFAETDGNAIGYFYQPEQDLYVVYDAANGEYGYMWEEPTAADFPGRALHKVTFDESGTIVGDIHDLTTVYDAQCNATLTCNACGFVMVSREVMHDYVDTTVICEQSGRQPRTALSHCTRCGDGCIMLTDGEGHTLRVLFEQASQASITMENTFRYDPTSWEWVGAGRDLTNCVIVTEIIADYDRSEVFGCDVVIPDLREAAGLTVFGIRFDDFVYRITDTPNLTVVFPEGMEFIGCHGSPLFSQVTAVVLPETLRYISEGGMQGYQGETLVLPASLEYWSDDGFHMNNLRSLTIKGAHYESTPYLWCPNLEELILLGTYDTFRGFGTPCKIEEFTVPDGVTVIAERTFEDMSTLKKVTLPESVTTIDRYAFRGCTNLSEINIPVAVTTMGESAFWECSALTRVDISGLTEIPNNAFWNCAALEEVIVGEQLTKVGRSAFQYCAALRSINLPATAVIGNDAFDGCTLLP